jgi:hypothetical protein
MNKAQTRGEAKKINKICKNNNKGGGDAEIQLEGKRITESEAHPRKNSRTG